MKARRKPPFNVNKFLATVDGGRSITNYGKNQAIFSQGDTADSVFYIREGKVKVTVRSDQGKEAVVAIHGKGDFFGEGCLNGQLLRLASAVAMADSTIIMRITKAAIVRTLREQPKFAEKFMAHLVARNARVEEDLVDQLFNSSEKRLARRLLISGGRSRVRCSKQYAGAFKNRTLRAEKNSPGPGELRSSSDIRTQR